jgi:CheY-like chemotaxis protein
MGVSAQSLPALRSHRPLTLLVDHDFDTRRMYAEFLKSAASEIEEAEDGREALAKALTRRPDVVITETRLPGIDGFELCSLLRTDATTHDIPILFVTGDVFEPERDRAERVGADAFLTKPCLPETLLLEMQRLLELSAELRERGRAVHTRFQEQVRRSTELLEKGAQQKRRVTLSRAHVRQQTIAPPSPPPSLMCPVCDTLLVYSRSHIGGVNARTPEQWDYYDCGNGCGTFQYRQRTRKVRRVT